MTEEINYIPITGTDFVRDMKSGAILNTNKSELNSYYAQRDIKRKELIEKEQFKNKLNQLETDIQEIKSMIVELTKMRVNNDKD